MGKDLDFVLMGTDYSRYFIDKVAHCLQGRGLDFSVGNITANSFPAGHRFVQLDESVRGNDLWVIHSVLSGIPVISDMDLFMIADAAKRSSCEKLNIATTFTEFRQDKKTDGRVAIYAKMFADILEQMGGAKLTRFATAHPHSEQVQGFFDVAFDSLPSVDVFEWYCRDVLFPHLGIDHPESQVLIYSGDGGSVAVNRRLGKRLGAPSLSLDKLRAIKDDGNESLGDRPNGNVVQGKYVLTLDDIMCSGGTACGLGSEIMELGALAFYTLATHGLFSEKNGVKCEDRIRKVKGMKVVTTDTVPRSVDYLRGNRDWLMGFISLAPLYAELIYRTVMHESVNTMFRDPSDKRFNPVLRGQLLDAFGRCYSKPEFFVNQLREREIVVPSVVTGSGYTESRVPSQGRVNL